MKLIHLRRFHDRGSGPEEAEPIVLVLSAVVAVAVPSILMRRFDLLGHARHLL